MFRDYSSQPYKITHKIIVLCLNISNKGNPNTSKTEINLLTINSLTKDTAVEEVAILLYQHTYNIQEAWPFVPLQ